MIHKASKARKSVLGTGCGQRAHNGHAKDGEDSGGFHDAFRYCFVTKIDLSLFKRKNSENTAWRNAIFFN